MTAIARITNEKKLLIVGELDETGTKPVRFFSDGDMTTPLLEETAGTFSHGSASLTCVEFEEGANLTPAVWPDGDGYIYNEGEFEDYWVEGHSNGDGEQSKESTYLYLYASDAVNGVRTWVTDEEVDLTDVDSIKVTISNWSGLVSTGALIASSIKTGGTGDYDARETFTADGTVTLDVSALSGDYYVRVHVTVTMTTGSFRITKVWVE